ncbi:retrovirus-related pol polyprotein from transposon TNT 1-94 [Tanacetum coccineum]
MFKLDIEPISNRLKNNRDAHEELLVYVSQTCLNSPKPSEKLVTVTPMNKKKRVRFAEPVTSSSNIAKQTGRTFTIVGNKCPLTRITSTKVVPTKETSTKSVATPTQGILAVQIVLWYLDSGCSKHMTGNRSQLINFVSKFSGTVRFGNDHIAKIMGYGDYQMGNVTISRVYYVEVLGHNLFFVGQFCDSDLEVAFRKHTCFIRDLDGVDLLKGSRGSILYTLSMDNLLLSSPICLLSKASNTKSWLSHKRLSYFNFDYITSLAKQGLVRGLPKPKYQKDHLCSACALGKSKKHSHKLKAQDSIKKKTLSAAYGSLRANEGSKTDNGTEFVNQTLRDYYEEVGISHQTSVDRTPQQNGVAPLFLWAKAVATACYTQNRSLIRKRHNKTPYELLHDQKPDLSYLYVFGALCYPSNDGEDLGKLKPKADIGIFISYAPAKKAFRIYNKKDPNDY